MGFLTDFADAAVVLPLVATVTLALLLLGWRRGAAAWLLALIGTLGVVLVLKLALAACAASAGLTTLHSPSGHTAAAAIVVGGLVVVLGRSFRLAVLAAVPAAGLIGVSRMAFGYHSFAEVVMGGAVGLAGTLVLYWVAGQPPQPWRVRWLAVAVMVVVVLFHGRHLDAEPRIHGIALHAAGLLAVCHAAADR